MKIVQVNHFFLDGGGREEYIYQISKRLAEMGNKVNIVTSDYTPTGKETLGNKVKKIKGIFLKTLKGYLVNVPPGRVIIPDLMDWLLKFNDYEIIHAHGMGEEVVLEAFYVAKIKKVPFVFTPHFHPYFIYQKLKAQKIWKVLQETQCRMIIENAEATIAFSKLDKETILKYTKANPKSKIYIIHNGIDETLPFPSKKEIKAVFKKYHIPPSKHYLIFLGDVTNPRKGCLQAAQVFREVRYELKDAHLLIVGPWGTRLKKSANIVSLITLLNKLTKAGVATITNWVPDFDKAALLSGSDLLLSPTLYDSFGVAPAEALYFKTPVVASKVGGIPYTVRNKIDGILVKNPEDIKGFAQACLKILKNKKLAERMGENGHKRVKKLFLLKDTVKKIANLYKKLIKKYGK